VQEDRGEEAPVLLVHSHIRPEVAPQSSKFWIVGSDGEMPDAAIATNTAAQPMATTGTTTTRRVAVCKAR